MLSDFDVSRPRLIREGSFLDSGRGKRARLSRGSGGPVRPAGFGRPALKDGGALPGPGQGPILE